MASRIVPSARTASRAAVELGGPVALKAIAPGLVHKSDAGAVRLGLDGPTAVTRAAREMRTQLEAAGPSVEGFYVQRMAPEGTELIRGLKTFPLLDGYRGRPPADVDSVRDLVMSVGALAAAHPAVAELDLNPVIATPEGAIVVDARVRLEAPGRTPAFPSLNG